MHGHARRFQRTTKASSDKAFMHNYKFDSKGATNIKSSKEKSNRLFVPEKTILERFAIF